MILAVAGNVKVCGHMQQPVWLDIVRKMTQLLINGD